MTERSSMFASLRSDLKSPRAKIGKNEQENEPHSCLICQGQGKTSSKHTVKASTVKRGEKKIQRREYEKTAWKKCKTCGGSGNFGNSRHSKVPTRGVKRKKRSDDGNDENGNAIYQTTETGELTPGVNFDVWREEAPTPTERECSSCADDKPIAEYGYKLTTTCSHIREVCQDCVVQWIETKIEEGQWNTITCPECDSLLEYSDLSQILSPTSDSFKRYDDLATQAYLNSIDEYRHCLSPTCTGSQIHSGGADNPIFTCKSCSHKSCTVHNVPWHENELCTDYDIRKANVASENQASEAEVLKIAKVCPKCGRAIEKNGGCDHMTCRACRYEFCYECLSDYARIRRDGNAFHGEECKYHTKRL